MWSPRGILQFVFSLLAILMAYGVYSYFFGRFDSLPPLPEIYLPGDQNRTSTGGGLREIRDKNQAKNQLIVDAFGLKSPELNRNQVTYLNYLFCFEEHSLEDGNLRLSNVSVAVFKTKPNEGENPKQDIREIITLRGETALIRFDKPIKNANIFVGGKERIKIVGGIIANKVRLHHNRGTSKPQDDLFVDCDDQVEFIEEQHRIFTPPKAEVHISIGEPPQAQIHGKGLVIDLTRNLPATMETAAGKAAKKKDAGMSVAGVRTIQLQSDVQMIVPQTQNLEIFGQAQKQLTGTDPLVESKKRPAISQSLVVKCRDQFTYDLEKQTADFHDQVNVSTKRVVLVDGKEQAEFDTLDSDLLTLEMIKVEKENVKPGTEGELQLSLKSVTAKGKVHITSDSRALIADCTELVHDHLLGKTSLKGTPDVIVKLRDYKLTQQGEIQLLSSEATPSKLSEVRGLGSGIILCTTSAPGLTVEKGNHRTAQWSKEMTWKVESDREMITLQGNTSFVDERWGNMKADGLTVTLAPERKEDSSVPAKDGNGPDQFSMDRLRKIEAEGRVSVHSPRMIIPQTRKLTIEFSEKSGPGSVFQETGSVNRLDATGKATPLHEATEPDQKPPITLEASNIYANMRFIPGRKEPVLVQANASEKVSIRQNDPKNPARNLLVTCESLNLQQLAEDNYFMRLIGPKCQVSAEKYQLTGPEIEMNQLENLLRVQGAGDLKMQTKTDIKGEKLMSPAWTQFRWSKSLVFDKKLATFLGQVSAEQSESLLTCGRMVVTLDQPVQFQQGSQTTKSGEQPGIESVVCDDPQPDRTLGKVVMDYRQNPGTAHRTLLRMEGTRLSFDTRVKNEGTLLLNGPGEVNIVRQGVSFNDPANGISSFSQKPPTGKATTESFKLTRILFDGRFTYDYSSNKEPSLARPINHVLNFHENVQVFYVPGEDMNVGLDPQKLPPGGIYISCKTLTEYQLKVPGSSGQPDRYAHEMTAQEKVSFRSPDYLIVSDRLKYEEIKGMVSIDANPGNEVKIIPQKQKGMNSNIIRGKGFYYDTKTGEFQSKER